MENYLQSAVLFQFLDTYNKIIQGEINLDNNILKPLLNLYLSTNSKNKIDTLYKLQNGFNQTGLKFSACFMELLEEANKAKMNNPIQEDDSSIKKNKLIFTKSEAAEIAGTTRQTLDTWVANKAHPLPECFPNDDGIKKGNPYIYYPDLVEYLEKRREIKAAKQSGKKTRVKKGKGA